MDPQHVRMDYDKHPDEIIAQIALGQHGIVERRQALAQGLTRHQIQRRCITGRWHPVLPGIYAVGHVALSWDARAMAAVLAGGEGAFLSHGSAAWKRGIWGQYEPRGPI